MHWLGVERLAAYYSPPMIEARPSEFQVPDPLSVGDFVEWKLPASEADVSINSRQAAFDMRTACRIDWLLEENPSDPSGSLDLNVYLVLDNYTYAAGSVRTAFHIGCAALEVRSSGVPLDLENWRNQFEAWWRGWREHWDEKDDDQETEPCQEDVFIPAGESTPDLSYEPPSRPAFSLETNCPSDLLKPIEEFHGGRNKRDWMKLASAYPDLDATIEERAEQLKEWYLGDEFGCWTYARHIDSWWREGRRACVVVRGIEHCMPDEEDPAR
ncbi:MAG: hypothetical protein N2C14_10430, partial [Planctomycetales bacterium]